MFTQKKAKLYLYALGVILVVLSLINFSLYFNRPRKIYVLGKSTDISSKEIYWKAFLEQNPTYFDGWIILTKLQIKLGKIEEAKVSFNKAVEIKPNSNEVEKTREYFDNQV